MSWLSKRLKKLKAKDLLKGVKAATAFIPGAGAAIHTAIESAEKEYAKSKKSAKEQAKVSGVSAEKIAEETAPKSNTLLYALGAGVVILFFMMKK